jgi:hypothetical protein
VAGLESNIVHRCAQTERSGLPGRRDDRACPAGPGGRHQGQTTTAPPGLTTLVAQAKQLGFQMNALSEQYDGLRIRRSRAHADAEIAEQAAVRTALHRRPMELRRAYPAR